MRQRRPRSRNTRPLLLILIAAAIGLALIAARQSRRAASPTAPLAARPTNGKAYVPLAAAMPILEAHAGTAPAALKGRTPRELEAAWPAWLSTHDAEIRARLERGDEDSLVNLWLFGTSFTSLPRATTRDLAKAGSRDKAEDLLLARLDDFVDAIAAPAENERLKFARTVAERRGIDPSTQDGKQQLRLYLVQARERMRAENSSYRRLLETAAAHDDEERLKALADVYRDRGLSSDTSLHVDFAVDEALKGISEARALGPGSVQRVAIVGPGLDFTDKVEGYDFYPQQTIQPFALIDSLIRSGLARPDTLHLTTFDLSPRVNRHVQTARDRAFRGESYVLQLPLDEDPPGRAWRPELVSYWQRFGSEIGAPVPPAAVPRAAGRVRVRAVSVRPPVVLSILPLDLNIVVERLDPLQDDQRYDLIVATNILVYYDVFDQGLAAANIAHMLRRGGLFLTNYLVPPVPGIEPVPSLTARVFWDTQHNGDTVLTHRKQ